MSIREVAGALERPPESNIRINEMGDGATVAIPRASLPLPIRLAAVLAALAVLVFVFSGIAIFTINSSSPLTKDLNGSGFASMTWYWKMFYGIGWLFMSALGSYALTIIYKPLTRHERILFSSKSLTLEETVFVKPKIVMLAYANVRGFSVRKDPQGMQESQLLVRLNNPSPEDVSHEIEIGQSTTEAEKRWLASVLNVFLAKQTGNAPSTSF